MSRDLDARGRSAAAGLKAAMAAAELRSLPPGRPNAHRTLALILRPVWVAVLLALGSAVGLAIVLDSDPGPAPVPAVTTTTIIAPSTTVGSTTTSEPAPPTTVAVVPIAPSTTVFTDLEPPALEIVSPEDGAQMSEKTVTFSGTTEPGARVFAGRYEAEVDSSGNWQIVLILQEGSNVARFVARDPAGNEAEASVTVHYVVPTTTTTEPLPTTIEKPTTTTTIKEEIAEFTAHATFGECSEIPPFDVYYGTGMPGSLVQVTSEHGSGSVEVGEKGNWEIKVIFAEAPPGELFVVRVGDEFGHHADFEFVHNP